ARGSHVPLTRPEMALPPETVVPSARPWHGNSDMRRDHPRRPTETRLPVLLALLAGLLLPVASAVADPPNPKVPDARARFKPTDAELTTSVEPAEAKPGETVTFKVTTKLKPGSHIYKYVKTKEEGAAGPRPTTFDFFDTAGLKIEGDWAASKEPIKHKEAYFPDLEFVEYYEDEVTWSIPLRIPPGTEPGQKALRVQAGYQICDDKRCSVPGQWTLPEAVVTVLSAGAAQSPPPLAAAPPGSSSAPPSAASAPVSPAPPATSSTTTGASSAGRPAAAPATAKTQSEIAQKAQQGLIPFLIASALGGFFALLMPCVWPMIPITVNFFVKQGQAGRGKTTGLAITYCLAIIGVYTAVGVLFSFFFSASALQTLANNFWLNLVVAALFVIFGL